MALDFVDPWGPNWRTHIEALRTALREGERVHLLMDAVFQPGLHRQLARAGAHVA